MSTSTRASDQTKPIRLASLGAIVVLCGLVLFVTRKDAQYQGAVPLSNDEQSTTFKFGTGEKQAQPEKKAVQPEKEGKLLSGPPSRKYTRGQRRLTIIPRGDDVLDQETPLTLLNSGKLKWPPATEKGFDGGYGWAFVKYHPSPFETQWREEAAKVEKEMGLCNLLKTKFSKWHNVYLSELPRMTPHLKATKTCNDVIPNEPEVFDSDVFSRFEYTYKCVYEPCIAPPPENAPAIGSKKFAYIEPLVGLIRHPGVCADESIVVNKNYMLVDAWTMWNVGRTNLSPPPRVLFFDGGASLWNQGAGGPSQSWFASIYASMCAHFSDWFMWEMTKHDPVKVFEQIPGKHKPAYRWFNVPLSVDPKSWDNPINHLLLEATQEDMVIVKIDFDAAVIEMALMEFILKSPEVASLIDELYFEHHVNMEILRRHWGTGNLNIYQSDSLKLFTTLRNHGIRAHSWV